MFDLVPPEAQPLERRERQLAMMFSGSYGFITPSAVPTNSDRVTPKINCFVTTRRRILARSQPLAIPSGYANGVKSLSPGLPSPDGYPGTIPPT